jgi:hypothetical protein
MIATTMRQDRRGFIVVHPPSIIRRRREHAAFAFLMIGAVALSSRRAIADEGGVSFWLPGTYGSLAAVPAEPGWSFSAFDYYASVSAGGNADFVRGGGIVADVKSFGDSLFVNPTYVFAMRRGDTNSPP